MAKDVKVGRTTLRLVTGDIAEQDTDAVVTAAQPATPKQKITKTTKKVGTFLLFVYFVSFCVFPLVQLAFISGY
jgi:nitrate reductase NapE component